MKSFNIGVVGAGNVGSHLCKALSAAGHNITVFTRRGATHLLKDVRGLSWTERLSNLKYGFDFILISVNDNAISKVADELEDAEGIVMHTSGTIDMRALKGIKKYGVFYPLQSFRKDKELNYKEIPVFIEGNNEKNLTKIKDLASSFSNSVVPMNSEQRKRIHLAAVVVNNFTNHLYTLSQDFLNKHSISFQHLLPLVKETAGRLEKSNPSEVQTGPARRNDNEVIAEHIKMLESDKDLKDIYSLLSDSIKNRYKNS